MKKVSLSNLLLEESMFLSMEEKTNVLGGFMPLCDPDPNVRCDFRG